MEPFQQRRAEQSQQYPKLAALISLRYQGSSTLSEGASKTLGALVAEAKRRLTDEASYKDLNAAEMCARLAIEHYGIRGMVVCADILLQRVQIDKKDGETYIPKLVDVIALLAVAKSLLANITDGSDADLPSMTELEAKVNAAHRFVPDNSRTRASFEAYLNTRLAEFDAACDIQRASEADAEAAPTPRS